eukprot:3036434-Pyramimonas_sp.AAC.1
MKIGGPDRARDGLRGRVLANVETCPLERGRRNLGGEAILRELAARAACKAGRCNNGGRRELPRT